MDGAREAVRPLAWGCAALLLDRLRAGRVSDRNVHNVTSAIARLVEVARIESGQPSSLSAEVRLTGSDLKEMLERVRAEAKAVMAKND